MSLASRIRGLRDHTMAELDAAHDYYVASRFAWQSIQDAIASGWRFQLQNHSTGTVTTEVELIAKASDYQALELAEATFQQFLAIFENFFFDLVRPWLFAYSRSLSAKQIDFKLVLDAPDVETIVQAAVDKEINEISYRRPAAWFA